MIVIFEQGDELYGNILRIVIDGLRKEFNLNGLQESVIKVQYLQ